jgi:hypothetical protein
MPIRLLLVTTLLLIGCRPYQQLTRQLPTFANMQAAATAIQRICERDGSVSEEAALSILEKVSDGRDDWGNRIVYASRSMPAFSFVLISPGQDGVFERDDPSQYFDAPVENIVGNLDRDIVFRDGEPVTIASGK